MTSLLLSSHAPGPVEDLDVVDDLSRREFIALVGAAGIVTACGSDDDADSDEESVTDTTGSDDSPIPPGAEQRIVAADQNTLANLLALGVVPVLAGGAPGRFGDRDHHPALGPLGAEDVDVFDDTNPPLEVIAGTQPDLIIGSTANLLDLYDTFETPVVGWERDILDPKTELRAIAAAIGREDRAEELIEEFDARVADLTATVASSDIRTLDLVLPTSDAGLVSVDTFGNEQLKAIGFAIPLEDELDADGGPFADLSLKQTVLLQSDALIITSIPTRVPDGERVEAFQSSPLYSEIPAVQDGRVFFLDNVSFFGNVGLFPILESIEGLVAELTSG